MPSLCLHSRSAGNCADDRPELCDEPVAHQLDDATAMFSQQWLQQCDPQILYRCERPGLVGLNEPRVADYIGDHDSGKPSFNFGHVTSTPGCFARIASHSGNRKTIAQRRLDDDPIPTCAAIAADERPQRVPKRQFAGRTMNYHSWRDHVVAQREIVIQSRRRNSTRKVALSSRRPPFGPAS